jgi:pimeloyl-ACP methyl ester carboxylesterase
MASARSEPVHAAGHELIRSFERPVLLAWSPEGPVFPIAHTGRYAGALQNAQLVEIPDAHSFTPEDQPAALADATVSASCDA